MTVEKEKLPRLDSYFWALALIWGGLIFGAESLDILPSIGEIGPWSWVFLGAGIVALGLSYFSLTSPRFSKPTLFDWIFGSLLFAIGLGGFLGVDISLPILLIVIGVAALASLLLSRD